MSFSCPSVRPEPLACARRLTRAGARLLLAGLVAAAALPAAAQDSGRSGRGAFPAARLEHPQRQEAAIRALGDRLPAVAAWYGMTPQRFAKLLREERNAWLDRDGRLFYQDEALVPQEATTDGGSLSTAQAAPYDLSQTFLLHSKPGSSRVLYLDFNGHAASNTAWSSGTINAPAFDLDGNPASFSDAEKERIQNIWLRVIEDYAPFDIDVTTQEPSADALLRTSSSDSSYGMRVVITHSSIGVCGYCAGIAYVGAFDFYDSANPGVYQPAWVLYDPYSGAEKYVAEVISHEAGHTLGLNHDGAGSSGYYNGHGSGDTGWAPIMGGGYSKATTQWSRGEYPDATNAEDDLAVMQTYGIALRADDAGNSMSAAASLGGTTSGGVVSVDRAGLIERTSDVDYYVFSTGGGSVSFTVSPAALGANLDILATLRNASGDLVASANDPLGLGATLNVTLAAGTYYLAVDGVGDLDPAPGYSDYASLGQYRIRGSYAASGSGGGSTATPPTAVVSANPSSGTAPLAVGFTGSGSSDADGSIVSYAWTFGDGTTSTAMNPSHTYAAGSYTATLTVTDSQGLKSSRSVSITASNPPAVVANTVSVQSITLKPLVYRNGSQCEASVRVRDGNGAAVYGATVSGSWGGNFYGGASAVSDSSGLAIARTGRVKAKAGTCSFSVTGLTLSGYSYDASRNLESSDSLGY